MLEREQGKINIKCDVIRIYNGKFYIERNCFIKYKIF